MIVSNTHKYVYISVPKAGTHTMYDVLVREYAGTQQEGPYHQTAVPQEYEDFFCFCTVRHPFHRAVSVWHALTQRENYKSIYLPLIGGESFLDFAKWISKITPDNRRKGKGGVLLLSQDSWLNGARIDRYLKLEELDNEFSSLYFVSGKETLPKILSRDYDTWDKVSCPESASLIYGWAKKDFERFDYSPDKL